ncbi:hypothetical protein GQ600_27779 [Phytophthora cactorum]|nr:hypothetical protein GQ600_27779 [Phytophthora cactorum]
MARDGSSGENEVVRDFTSGEELPFSI